MEKEKNEVQVTVAGAPEVQVTVVAAPTVAAAPKELRVQALEKVAGKVLVIEDDPDLAFSITKILRQNSYVVRISLSRADALFRISNEKYDCIVSDLNLGQHNRADTLIEALRESNNPNRLTPVLVHSAHVDRDFVLSFHARVQAVLVKPTPLRDIVSKVQELIVLKLGAE